MREILFRAKRLDNGEWREGYVFDDGFVDSTRRFIGDIIITDYKGNADDKWEILGTDFYEVDPETICRYTGLTDKNGNKIWENDIVSHIKYSEYKAKVVYGEFNCSCCYGVYGWTLDSIVGYSEVCDIRDCSSIEVIGNIFDGELQDDSEKTKKD